MSDSKKSCNKKCQKSCKGCATFIYDKEAGTFCGRTLRTWCLLIVFYIIFFSSLTGFFSLLLYMFMNVFITDSSPYLTGQQSLLFSRAGLNVYPKLSLQEALIIFSTNPKDTQAIKYEEGINTLFKKAFEADSNNVSVCLSDQDQPTDIRRFCKYHKDDLGPCKDPLTQMKMGNLCIFVRVNKVYGWLPDIINMTSSNDILLDCKGQNPGDVVNLGKPVYFPSYYDGDKSYGMIPSKYFPFINQKGYVSPMVAIQFPEMKNNTAVLMQCQIINLRNAFKFVKFEVMVLDRKV